MRVSYYLVRDVVRGAACSYPYGRTLLRNAGLPSRLDAQRLADSYNDHCGVAGCCYLVLPHAEDRLPDCDQYEQL